MVSSAATANAIRPPLTPYTLPMFLATPDGLIHAFKYGKRLEMAGVLGGLMADFTRQNGRKSDR
ncbi:hypothetical protein [Paludibacterium denitrificans]|uniref:hypothetical protein n=1 Tax=Paludibacterium denitrificans TaxID=2675226 RepID=UPI001E5E696F|nr:hypothetical protein [Paludibacterium denitrificans]